MTTAPPVSIILPVHDDVVRVRACLEALIATTPEHLFELIAVDLASTDGARSLLLALEGDVRVLPLTQNPGFAVALNLGARVAAGRYIMLLHPDVETLPGWSERLLEAAERQADCAAVGPMLVTPSGGVEAAGGVVFRNGERFGFGSGVDPSNPTVNDSRDVDFCASTALLVKREAWEAAGGLDEQFAPEAYADVDLCFKLRRIGLRVLYAPQARVVHHATAAPDTRFAGRFDGRNQLRFVAKWGEALANQYAPDPALIEAAAYRLGPDTESRLRSSR